MKIKFILCAATMVAFMAALVFAQHGRVGGSPSSMHGDDHSSSAHNKAGSPQSLVKPSRR